MSADHYITDADMTKVADAIRVKGGTSAPLVFPDGMKTAIENIQTGGGGNNGTLFFFDKADNTNYMTYGKDGQFSMDDTIVAYDPYYWILENGKLRKLDASEISEIKFNPPRCPSESQMQTINVRGVSYRVAIVQMTWRDKSGALVITNPGYPW